jgi:competence protein ComEC
VQAADGATLLLTGDIEVAQERMLIERLGPDGLRSTVVIAPHHGSRTSSSAAFIAATAPRFVVFQAGYRSRFGHPAPDVVSRYQNAGAAVVRTDRCGAWTWTSGAPQGLCERDRRRRYWHWRDAGPQAERAGPGSRRPY